MKKKQKKKANRIILPSHPLYGIARINRLRNTAELRGFLSEHRIFIKDNADFFLSNFGIQISQATSLVFPDESVQSSSKIHADSLNYSFIKKLAFSIWEKDRTIIQVSNEALALIDSDTEFLSDDIPFCNLVYSFYAPILIRFPDGSGVFYAASNISITEFKETAQEIYYLLCPYSEEENKYYDSYLMAANSSSKIPDICDEWISTRKDKTNKNDRTFFCRIFRALGYLAYVSRLNIFEHEMMGIHEDRFGSPVSRLVTIPGLKSNWNFAPPVNGYNIPKYGVHPYFGFLSVQSMCLFANQVPDENDPKTSQYFPTDQIKRAFKTIHRWLSHGIIFTANDKFISFCTKRYNRTDFSKLKELLPMIPVREFIISLSSQNKAIVVDLLKQRIGLEFFIKSKIPEDMEILNFDPQNPKNEIELLVSCILFHIGRYYQKRAEVLAKQTKKTAKPTQKNGELSVESCSGSSIGYNVDIDGLTLYELSPRSVKQISRKERASRYGWKMPTHIRCGHYHRYWVGTGENRHLEYKWLEAVIINAGEGAQSSRTHDLLPSTD